MRERPVPDRLDGIVRAVGNAPMRRSAQVAPRVDVFFRELLDTVGVRSQQRAIAIVVSPPLRLPGADDEACADRATSAETCAKIAAATPATQTRRRSIPCRMLANPSGVPSFQLPVQKSGVLN
jgi:hypothetical protein